MASEVPAGRPTRRRAAGAARPTTRGVQAGPVLHRDAYPVGRVATEFFLRCLELILELDDDVTGSLIVMTLLRDAVADPDRGGPVYVRELSRRLALPFETVRRHAHELVRNGVCVGGNDGISLAAATRRAARTLRDGAAACRKAAEAGQVRPRGASRADRAGERLSGNDG